MKVDINGTTYVVAFRTINERRVHDMPPQILREFYRSRSPKLPFSLFDIPEGQMPLVNEFFSVLRKFTRLRPMRHISTITTRCTIRQLKEGITASRKIKKSETTPIASGWSFYSITESAPDGKPFSHVNAQARALKRALGQDIVHREGRVFVEEEIRSFWQAFNARHTDVARVKGAAVHPAALARPEVVVPSSADAGLPPTPA